MSHVKCICPTTQCPADPMTRYFPSLQKVVKHLEQFILRCIRRNGITRTQFEPINSPTLPIIEVEARSITNIYLVGKRRRADPRSVAARRAPEGGLIEKVRCRKSSRESEGI